MKIGYMSNYSEEEEEALRKYGVDRIIKRENWKGEIWSFDEIIEKYPDDEIILSDLSSIGNTVTLIQLLDSFKTLYRERNYLCFINQGLKKRLSNREFHGFLIKLAEFDKKAVVVRTHRGIEEAKSEGRVGGRPSIDEETIEEIQFLYTKKKMGVRKISEKCRVSLGTVSKYTNQIKNQ